VIIVLSGSDAFVLRNILDELDFVAGQSNNIANNSQHIEDLYNILCKIDLESQKSNLLKMYELGLMDKTELLTRINNINNERQRLQEYYVNVIANK